MKIQYWFQSMEQPVTTRSDREKYDCIHGMTKFHTVHGVHHWYKISGRTMFGTPVFCQLVLVILICALQVMLW